MTENKLHNELKEFLERESGKWQYDEKSGCYFGEPYVDYNDELTVKEISNILGQDEPEWALEDRLSDYYQDTEWQYHDDIIDKFQKTEEGGKYDYDEIDDKASLVWLAKTQGYTKEQLQNQLTNGEDKHDTKGFLETVYQEIINCSTSCPTLVFPIKMTLEQAMKICKIINNRDEGGYKYNPEEREDCGSIIIDKNVECALYDYDAGGGGCWGIELEKDVELPIKFIYMAIPDGVLPYSMGSCYGVTSECWKKAIKGIK